MGGTNWSSLITYEQCTEKIMKYHTIGDKLISVGSGYGVLEKHIVNAYEKQGQNIYIICIDPEPTSYSFKNYPKEPMIHPYCAYVDDYLKQLQSLKSNCDSLLLCWPEPNESTYDLEAIIKLQPAKVFLIYEMTGTAGSGSLHNWIYNQCSNIPKVKVPLFLNSENIIIFKKEGYKCIDYIIYEYEEQFQYALLVLSRE